MRTLGRTVGTLILAAGSLLGQAALSSGNGTIILDPVETEKALIQLSQLRLQASHARLKNSFGPSGRLPDDWWNNPDVVSHLNLTSAQVQQMEDTFQQHRQELVDLSASLESEQRALVAADDLDEAKLSAQIDRVAQARAELEKARGRMLLGIRKVLVTEQWRRINELGFSVTRP